MSLTSIVTQFALTVGASLAERIASALSSRIKQEPEPEANPVDIAIATKSAVSADREGKIASERGLEFLSGEMVTVKWPWYTQASDGVVCKKEADGRYEVRDAQGAMWRFRPSEMTRASKPRRLGDYGPSGGG